MIFTVWCAATMFAAGALAGRDEELQLLVDAVAPTSASPGVLVVGEAGIGKTRLVAEARRVLKERHVTTVSGACLRMSASLPFLPIVDLLREIVVLKGGELVSAALRAVP